MPTIEVRTGFLFYDEVVPENSSAKTPVMVFLHANPGDHRDFDAVVPVFGKTHRVLAIDWPGYGNSPAPKPASSASAMLFADVLEDFVEELNLSNIILVGNSVGGFASLRFAIRKPELLRGVIVVNSGGFTKYNAFTKAFVGYKGTTAGTKFLGKILPRLYLKVRTPTSNAILERSLQGLKNPERVAVDAAVWRSFVAPAHNLIVAAESIKVPILIVWGKHDPILPLNSDGRTIQATLKDAEFVVIHSGHEPFAENLKYFWNMSSLSFKNCKYCLRE